jgi:hypothetical protein
VRQRGSSTGLAHATADDLSLMRAAEARSALGSHYPSGRIDSASPASIW